MRKSISTAAALAAVILVSTFAAPRHASAVDYVVRRGDTLSRLASRFGTSVDAIRRANRIRGDLIIVGQTLDIPIDDDAASGGSTSTVPTVHVVRRGDSLSRIATRFGTTVSAIRAANGIRGSLIHPGQEIVIPDGASSPPSGPAIPSVTGRVSARDLEILARITKGEASARGSFAGQAAIAAVVLNRVADRRFPSSISGVVFQPQQFSAYNRENRNRLYWGTIPQWAWDAARAAVAGYDPTEGATHYFNPFLVRPRWSRRLVYIKRIDSSVMTAHDFFRHSDSRPRADVVFTLAELRRRAAASPALGFRGALAGSDD